MYELDILKGAKPDGYNMCVKTNPRGTNERAIPQRHGPPFVWRVNMQPAKGGEPHIAFLKRHCVRESVAMRRVMRRASYLHILGRHGTVVMG